MFEELNEQLIQYFSKAPHQEDFTRAKNMYMKTVGIVVEEHPYFDSWISGFFEWYLIDYKMLKLGVPPVYLYQRVFSETLDPKEMEFLQDMEKSHLSLFEVQSVSGQKIKATDLYSSKNVEFHSHENTALINRGDYIVTRILHTSQKVTSFGVMWHLSGEISSIVSKKLQDMKTPVDQEMFLYELIKRKGQSEVYSHVPLDQIFGWKTGAEMKVQPRKQK
ncbi:MAG: hypothetical protein IT286_00920 [Proteobacteria bacterium]|jgi:hypothetical protein|nr:hypothetical protein [Pseudomonadota bacterium]